MRYRRLLGCCLLLAALWLTSFAACSDARPLADSVILFIGDGMGPGQIAMTRGAVEHPLAMARMSYSGMVTTVSLGGKVTDSAAASTALATGHKVENGVIAMSPGGQPYETILERCRKHNKVAGIATTDALWGATPAGFVAHVMDRDEGAEIAAQEAKSRLPVMLGFWKDELLPTSAGGKREDKLDLIAQMQKEGYEIVYTRSELLKAKGQSLVGLFDDGPEAARVVDMVNAALPRLGTNADGFFLVLEHARIDWEPGDPSAVMADVLQLDEGVSAAVAYARKQGRTLVLVTGDHETGGLQIVAPKRLPALKEAKGSMGDIAGHLDKERSNIAQVMAEYAGIKGLTAAEADQIKAAKDAGEAIGAVLSDRGGVAWTSNGDHTATPVPIFAFGPGAERFTGEMDNTDIPKRIGDVLGIGPFPKP
jgi:alkaline phosphatase